MSVKQYETLVRKIADTPESKADERAALVAEKKAVVSELQKKAVKREDKRKLKFTLDEINNS